MVDAVDDRFPTASGDRHSDRVQTLGAEQIGDRTTDTGQIEHQFGMAEKGLLLKQPTGVLDDCRVRCVERQPLQMTALEERLPTILEAMHRGEGGGIDRLTGVDTDRVFAHGCGLGRNGSKELTKARSSSSVRKAAPSSSW